MRQEMRLHEARTAELALEDHAQRGELRIEKQGPMRLGKIRYRISWDQLRTFLFVLDVDASELCFPALASNFGDQSAQFKTLRTRLRGGVGRDMTLFVRRSALTLRMTVRDAAYAHCTSAILQVAKELVTDLFDEGASPRMAAKCGQRIDALRPPDSYR